ncbi:MAG: hypothetical protein ACKVT1_16185 [Dehalococcoidia bacterium]
MRAAAGAVTVLLAALVQVTVVPLFPLGGAVADAALLTLAGVALFMGPHAAMIALPALCLFLGFASDRSPGLLLIAYLPLLPLAGAVEEARLPANRFVRLLLAVVVAGVWARVVLSGSAFVQGAAFAPGPLLTDVVIPGLVLDAILLSLLYLPPRLAGWSPESLTLRRMGRY